MNRSAFLISVCLGIAAHSALADNAPPAPSQQAVDAARAACATDIQKLCPSVQPGGGRIIACLKEHKSDVSDGCKQVIAKAAQSPPAN